MLNSRSHVLARFDIFFAASIYIVLLYGTIFMVNMYSVARSLFASMSRATDCYTC